MSPAGPARPTGEQRADLAARLDLLGVPLTATRPTRADRAAAQAVELPHLWVFYETELLVWCRTCDTSSRSCRGDRDQARAALAARDAS